MTFSVGDVVTINSEGKSCNWYIDWHRLNGDGPFLVTGDFNLDDGLIISHMDGSPERLASGQKLGIARHFLQKDPFLTAARKAITEAI